MSKRYIYAQKAINQIPRLLSCLDRNEFSQTFGCFNREFWLTRVRDFPDAIAQLGTLSLSLVWSYKFPDGEKFYQNPELKKWIIGSFKYWIKIQHQDGSYDEFYPNERGWAGPTGFLLYGVLRSYELLEKNFPADLEKEFFNAVKKSAWFLATREEEGVLANHHAMALLPIYQAYYHFKKIDPIFAEKLYKKFEERLNCFFNYCYDEGWCLEYDGADPGYLSALVSFLSKMQKYMQGDEPWAKKIQTIIDKGIEFSSYFLYPNGSYGGTLGSRQTLHFYAHGYELQGKHNKLASSCAEFAAQSLVEKKLVPPEIQDDRYYLYRIPEFLEAYIDYQERSDNLPMLPSQQNQFIKYFPQAKFFIKNNDKYYLIVNLAKGGVVKFFDKEKKELIFSEDGILIGVNNNKILTTQWIGPEYFVEQKNHDNEYSVKGNLHIIPQKYFTPIKMIVFRLFILSTGWNAKIADLIKGLIRKLLMTRSSKTQVKFTRNFFINENKIIITNEIQTEQEIKFLQLGGQFASRYVPQSRYFQWEELDNKYWQADKESLQKINKEKKCTIISTFDCISQDTQYTIK